jgi:hypothetical protein
MPRVLAHFGEMSRFRIILSAGVCSIALSGCIPAAAGLALSAASLFTGGSGGKGGDGFRNPMDRQSTGQQVRQALSRLNDQVDPGCQAKLDEHLKTHGTLTPGTTAKSAPESTPDSGETAAKEQPSAPDGEKKPTPVNLLAKLDPQPKETAGADVAVSADTASEGPAAASAIAAVPPADAPPAEVQPVKASLGAGSSPAPGHCEHRLVCLPGTPKPTLMLMCPGKGDPKKNNGQDTATTAAGDSPQTTATGVDATPSPQAEQATAALSPSAGDAAVPAAPEKAVTETVSPEMNPAVSPAAEATPTDTVSATAVTIDLTPGSAKAAGQAGTPSAPQTAAETAAETAAGTVPASQSEPVRRTIEGGGVADWNWSFDPSKRL